MKILAFITVCLFWSCHQQEQVNQFKIELNNKQLVKVMKTFKDNLLFDGKVVHGVIGLKVHGFCESDIYEIWKINHINQFKEKQPAGFLMLDKIPVFVFDDISTLDPRKKMNLESIEELTAYFNLGKVNDPPRTEFGEKYLYKKGYPVEDIFNVKDTLINYDPEILESKIKVYCGKLICD